MFLWLSFYVTGLFYLLFYRSLTAINDYIIVSDLNWIDFWVRLYCRVICVKLPSHETLYVLFGHFSSIICIVFVYFNHCWSSHGVSSWIRGTKIHIWNIMESLEVDFRAIKKVIIIWKILYIYRGLMTIQ